MLFMENLSIGERCSKEEWDDRMRGAKITLGLKDGNVPLIVSIKQVMNKTI